MDATGSTCTASQFAGFDHGQNGEDWESWLRWDPTTEVTSPDEGTFNSASSKNDSPIQDSVYPVGDHFFGKGGADDTLAPPLIVGEGSLDFNVAPLAGNEPFLFGGCNDVAAADFDFGATASFPPMQEDVSRVDSTWSMLPSAPSDSITLSALSNENGQTVPSGPPSASTPSLHYSPGSSSQPRTSISNSGSPAAAPKKRGGRKRKVAAEEDEVKDETGDSQEDGEPPVKKTSHNVIEKRYRNNLNDKIVELRNSVPSLRAMKRANRGEESEDLGGLTAAHKLNKATVMAKATEYIKHLEKRNKSMADEMAQLKARLAAVEEAIGKTRDRQASISTSPPCGTGRPREASASSQSGASGFLNVPADQTRYGQAMMAAQYMQPQQQPIYARPPNPPVEAQNQPQYVYGRGAGMMNKVMMGAMAGIMVMEGYNEHAQDDSRGLLAAPTALFRRGFAEMQSPSSTAALVRHAGLPLMKVVCIIAAVTYLVLPLISSPRRKQKATQIVHLPKVPTLASPVEVRREAWLTALQTVYVPKHFLLEVAAVTSKMFKLSLRRLVGSDVWNAFVGVNKEEEAARIKAWDIAIDAQLAGGDAEVSYYRLLLTLMSSGTLPDSPVRLMQKAVHFRVFFWEVANAGYGNIFGFKHLTEKVGKFYWDSARRIQNELVHNQAQSRVIEDDEVELLPDHLASLLELDCDEVLGDEMIQRAWNLAWNKPSAHNTTANAARDGVVEDHAIRSPLDAVAAWYAHMVIDDTLLDMLGDRPSSMDIEYYLRLAISISPPASETQLRAFATKAVLSNANREANIIAALEALPASPPTLRRMNLVSHAPANPEIHIALTVAKLLSLLSNSTQPASLHRAYRAMANLYIPPSSFTLLTAVATYILLRRMATSNCARLPPSTLRGLEDLAGSLRVWIGTSGGRNAGLQQDDYGRVVDLCLRVAKEVGGWDERDSGYGSVETSPVRARDDAIRV